MTSQKKISVSEHEKGQRLDLFLSEILGISRSQAQHMIDAETILVDGRIVTKSGYRMVEGSTIEIVKIKADTKEQKTKDREELRTEEKEIFKQIKIVADIDDYLVVNKPSGLLVHPTSAGEKISLASWVVKKYPNVLGVGDYADRPGIVHRLDKEASGLLVIAKNQKMFDHLKIQFQERSLEKIYSVLVYGDVEKDHATIDFDIDRGKEGKMVSRPRMNELTLKNVKHIQEGKKAMTEFWVEQRFSRFTLLKVKIHSGRTHQIRVHMFAYNHPVAGDTLYSNKKLVKKGDMQLDRLFLHAEKLCFADLADKMVCFECALPKELLHYLDLLH